MNRLKMGFTLAIICASILLGAGIALGQGIITGNLAGAVQDATGAVVPGAKVTVTKPDTNAVFTATSGANGNFSLNDLPVGIYNVKFEASGFSTLTVQNVRVDSNHTVDLGVQKLSTGTATTTVEVNANEALLETTQAQISTTFDTQQVANIPTFGGFDELTLLIPGVVATHANNFSNTNGTGFSSKDSAAAPITLKLMANRTTTTRSPVLSSSSQTKKQSTRSRSSPTTSAQLMAATWVPL